MWAAEHDKMRKQLTDAGASAAEIAAQLNATFNTNYSRNAVIGRCQRRGQPTRGSPVRKDYAARRAAGPAPAPTPRKPPPRIIQPRAVIEAACAGIVPLGIRCEDLEPPHCRWPYGDGPIVFCGHGRLDDAPYCPAHWQLSVGTGTTSERRASEGA